VPLHKGLTGSPCSVAAQIFMTERPVPSFANGLFGPPFSGYTPTVRAVDNTRRVAAETVEMLVTLRKQRAVVERLVPDIQKPEEEKTPMSSGGTTGTASNTRSLAHRRLLHGDVRVGNG
jgi:hypothetical protein